MRARWIRAIGAALLAAPLALATGAGPAGAGDDPLGEICGEFPTDAADGLIAPHFGKFIGEGVLNVTGEDQSTAIAMDPGSAVKFDVSYQNNDNVPQDIVVRGDFDGDLPTGFVVKVFRSTNGKDVTDKVFGAQGLRFRDLDPGIRTQALVIRVKRLASSSPDAFIDAFVTGNYGVASACGDTVRASAGAP